MSEMVGFRVGAVHRGNSRQVARTLSQIADAAEIGIARIESRSDVEIAKISAAVAVTQHALAGAQFLTNIEMLLAEQTPAAMSRLGLIGQAGSMALAGVVYDTASKMRRV